MYKYPNTIFDIHVHLLGREELDAEFLAFARARDMRFGISCLGPDGVMLPSPSPDQVRRANDMVLRLMADEPDRAFGFCYANPLHGKQAVHELQRCVSRGMSGLKLWIACRCSDPRVFPLVEASITLGIPVLLHSWSSEDARPEVSTGRDVADLAARYPQARLIAAHMAYHWREGVDAVRDLPNVMVDTCGFDPEAGCIEHAIKSLGVERVLFGSDAPGRDILCQIGKVVAADIPDDERGKVLYLNAERLLGIGER